MCLGNHAYGHPPPPPELYCRDTNTTIYAEVCVPAFAEQVTPVTLAVKEVVDNDYCFDRVLTICEETNTVVRRDICNYVYELSFICIQCELTYPAPVEICVTKDMTFCEETNTVDKKGFFIGENDCENINANWTNRLASRCMLPMLPTPSTWSTMLPTTWYITLTTSRLRRTHSLKLNFSF